MVVNPDILNYAWRDYGVRVGIWRLMEIMAKFGVRGTVALNSDVCREYPRIIEEGKKLGWEWMGHGTTNSILLNQQTEAEERALIKEVVSTIARAAGKAPRGWLSPGMTETVRTLDILAENGIEYTGNWVNDEQPYPMKVKKGSMISMPYSSEINDIPALLSLHQSPERFGQMICDQFDVLYEDGATSGRVMSICLHPFIIGHPHRSKVSRQGAGAHHLAAGGLARDRQRDRRLVQEELFEELECDHFAVIDRGSRIPFSRVRGTPGFAAETGFTLRGERTGLWLRNSPALTDRLADLVDLHRAHALVVGRGVEPADLEARQIVHQEGVGAHAVERADVACEQRTPLLIGEIERAERLGRIGLHRRAERVVAQDLAAEMIDGKDRHERLHAQR